MPNAIAEPDSLSDKYFGHDLSDIQCEARAVIFIDRRHYNEKEAELFNSKWFDYRSLHPIKATYLYSRAYRKAHSNEMRVRLDYDRGQYMTGIKGMKSGDMFDAKPASYMGLWRGRQEADKMGVPYDFYCRTIMRWAEERGWRHLPRANQMYSTDARDHVLTKWIEEREVRAILPESDFYLARNYVGHPSQDSFRSYLSEMVSRRIHKKFLLSRLIYGEKMLDETTAIQMFGNQIVKDCNPDSLCR